MDKDPSVLRSLFQAIDLDALDKPWKPPEKLYLTEFGYAGVTVRISGATVKIVQMLTLVSKPRTLNPGGTSQLTDVRYVGTVNVLKAS